MTRANQREWTKPIYCDKCHRSIYVVVAMLLPIPAKTRPRVAWIDRAQSLCEAEFQKTHAETCGRKAP